MTDKKLMVSGFDLFYYEITDEQAANIATAIDGKAWEFGDGWCVTKKLDNYMYVPEAEIYFAVRGTTLQFFVAQALPVCCGLGGA